MTKVSAGTPGYVHGTHEREQRRLALMNRLINEPSLAVLTLTGGERVLDVGCGLAFFSRLMAHAVAPDGCVVGVEHSYSRD